MKGYKTSFVGMFQPRHDGMPTVNLVEIPLIQRDYAQGRQGADVEVIRRDFLDGALARSSHWSRRPGRPRLRLR